MTQRIDLEKVAQVALNYALTKTAGVYSELIGNTLNPLNQFGGQVGGGIAALTNPTRTDEDQAKADKSILANLFVPGVAPYNTFKRIGYSIRNPRLLEAKDDLAYGEWKQRQQREDRFKDREQSESQDKKEKTQTKAANAFAYALTKSAVGNFNWQHALTGAGLGAGAGALSGMLMPGKDDEDEDDRAGSALWRALLAGGLGGLAGGYGGKYITPYLSGAAEQPQFRKSWRGGTVADPGMHNANYAQNLAPHLQPAGPKQVNPDMQKATAPQALPPRPNINFPDGNRPQRNVPFQ